MILIQKKFKILTQVIHIIPAAVTSFDKVKNCLPQAGKNPGFYVNFHFMQNLEFGHAIYSYEVTAIAAGVHGQSA